MSIFSKDILNDKIAIVTGASRGIGSDIAIALSESGAYAVSYTHLTLPTNREV